MVNSDPRLTSPNSQHSKLAEVHCKPRNQSHHLLPFRLTELAHVGEVLLGSRQRLVPSAALSTSSATSGRSHQRLGPLNIGDRELFCRTQVACLLLAKMQKHRRPAIICRN